MPDEPPASQSNQFVPNPEAFAFLLGMGFPEVRIKKSLRATGNADPEAALNWVLAHMDDADIDDPADLGGSSTEDDAKIGQLGDMGIDPPKARRALKETGGDVNRALDWVFSHPDETGEPENADASSSDNHASKCYPGSTESPAMFELQSIICHKGVSVHTG